MRFLVLRTFETKLFGNEPAREAIHTAGMRSTTPSSSTRKQTILSGFRNTFNMTPPIQKSFTTSSNRKPGGTMLLTTSQRQGHGTEARVKVGMASTFARRESIGNIRSRVWKRLTARAESCGLKKRA